MGAIRITKEQYLRLLPIERQLRNAMYSGYARLSVVDFNAFCEVYAAVYGRALTNGERNCNTCRLKALKRLGEDYFYFKDTYFKRWGMNPEEKNNDVSNSDEDATD